MPLFSENVREMNMTKNKNLSELLSEAEKEHSAFYQRAIELHKHSDLRISAARAKGGRIYIVKPNTQSNNELFYDSDGFNAKFPTECLEEGNAWENPVYRYTELAFVEREGKLVVNAGEYGTREMLALFPKITIGTIEEKLAKSVLEERK